MARTDSPPGSSRSRQCSRSDSGSRSRSSAGPRSRSRPRSLGSDTRSVSPVIGAVLMLAVGILLVAVLQTTAIPSLNAQHEFQHSQGVQTDLLAVGAELDRAAVRDAGATTTVDLGLRYPPRLVFVNPPPVSGRLATGDPAPVTIRNAAATGETGDYWNGSPRTFETRALVYTPDYHEYDAAPRTVVEPWVVYNRIGDRTLPKTGTDLVEGRRISLVAIRGDYQAETADSTAVAIRPTSAPVRTVTVGNETAPVTLTVPTGVRRDAWEELLADELDPSGSDPDRYVTDLSCSQAPPQPCGELTLTLEPGQYELALGATAVDTGTREEPPAYLTTAGGANLTVPDTGTHPVAVAVRDRFNAPVSGVQVEFSATGGTLQSPTARTDDDGEATVPFTPSGAGTATVTARADLDGSGTVEADEEVTVAVEVFSTAGGGGGGGGGGGCEIQPWSSTNTTRTFAGANTDCLWTGLSGVSSFELSDPRLTPLTGNHDEVDDGTEYFRMTFIVRKGTTHYLVEVTDNTDGLKRSLGGGWGNRNVRIYRRDGDTKYDSVASLALQPSVLEAWYRGQSSIDLLSASSYEKNDPDLVQFRNFMRANQDVEMYLVEMDGRVTVTAT